jgi:hypothetical protein
LRSVIYYLVSFIFLISSTATFCQSVSTLIGARANGIGYASSAIADEWGVFNNIAGTAKVEKPAAACSYDLQPTLIGANRSAVVFAVPVKIGVVSGGVYRFGDDIYNEQLLSAGFSNKIGLAALGAQVNYIQYSAEGFGTKGVWSLNLGGIAELTPHLSIGAYIINVNQPTIGEQETLPTKLVVGIGFKPIDKVFIATELEKDLDYDPIWKMGIEYKFHKKFCARTGYNINPNKAFFGLGFIAKRITIDYATQYNFSLSMSHQATVSYQFSRK